MSLICSLLAVLFHSVYCPGGQFAAAEGPLYQLGTKKSSTHISVDIVIAIRLYLICLNFFIFLFLNSHFNFNSWRT